MLGHHYECATIKGGKPHGTAYRRPEFQNEHAGNVENKRAKAQPEGGRLPPPLHGSPGGRQNALRRSPVVVAASSPKATATDPVRKDRAIARVINFFILCGSPLEGLDKLSRPGPHHTHPYMNPPLNAN